MFFSRNHQSSRIQRKRRAAGFSAGLERLEDRVVLTYLPPVSYAVGASPAGVTVGKFNADAFADIAVVNQAAAGTVSVLLGNGDGTFQPKVDYAAGPNAVDARAADFNGDGKTDLAVVGTSGTVSVLLGNGDGSFAAPTTNAVGAGSHSMNLGDFNGDGKLDVATMNGTTASVLLGNGDGTFQPRLDVAIPGNSTNTVVGDFNRDGFLDLATSNTASVGTITILKGHGDGSFDPAASVYAYSAPVYLSSGDFNHDGHTDFAVANSYAATSMSVILDNGDGTYAPPKTYDIAQTGYEIEVQDFNGDGNADFAVRGSTQYMVRLGKGDGTFYPQVNYPVTSGRFEMGGQADLNGDGAVDFLYPSSAGLTVVMNSADDVSNLAGAVGFNVSVPASSTSGSSLPMTVTAVDAAGNPVAGFLGTVYVTSNDPASPTTVAYKFTPADAGIHVFNGSVSLVTQGTQTVTVAAPFMAAATRTVTVTPGVSSFGVTSPATSAAGNSFSVTVTALDSLGNIGTGYTSSVHFTSSDVQAGLPTDYTFTPADAGVHTFTVTLKSAGSRFVGVTETGGKVGGGVSVNVTPGTARSFALAGPGGAIGVSRPVTVVATDAFGNTDTANSSTVRLISSDPSAVFPAAVSLVNGIATFSATFMTVGTQTITATDVSNPALSGTFSSAATPPVAKLFTVTGYPNTTAGASNSFTVSVKDTIGQTVTGYTGTIYFSSSDAQAGLPASYTFTAADAGVHSFNATFKTSGSQSINVIDPSRGLSGSQVGISVDSAAFSGFQLSVPLGTDSKGHYLVVAGDSIALTVKAVDIYGNTVTGYVGNVKFTSTDVQAGLPAAYTFTAADAGVHSFPVSLKTATVQGAVWSFTATDSRNAAALATLTNFEVTNAAAAKFLISAPSNATAGLAFTVKVSVFDAYGNRVKNYFGKVHFGSSAVSSGLPADYTFDANDAGVHTFNVILTAGVDQTLTVTDTLTPLLTASALVKVKASGGGGGGGGGGGKTP